MPRNIAIDLPDQPQLGLPVVRLFFSSEKRAQLMHADISNALGGSVMLALLEHDGARLKVQATGKNGAIVHWWLSNVDTPNLATLREYQRKHMARNSRPAQLEIWYTPEDQPDAINPIHPAFHVSDLVVT